MARPKRTKAVIRLNLEISRTTKDMLNYLKDKTDADSYSEVIRKAISLYYNIKNKTIKADNLFIL